MKDYLLVYEPRLAKVLFELGLPSPTAATLFLRQTAHWLGTNSGHYTKDGRKWIYNSYKDWIKEQFPSLSESQFGRMFRALKNWGFVIGSSFAQLKEELVEEAPVAWQEHNTTTWLTLDFERIYEVTGWLPRGVELPQDSPEPAPDTDLHICTSDNSNLNRSKCEYEPPSIYIEDHISHQRGGGENKKETGVTKEHVGYNPPMSFDQKQELESKPNTSKQDKSRQNSPVPKKRTNSDVVDEVQVAQYIWEIAKGAPYQVFLNWRANIHYKPQGGRWETGAHDIAYAEFYNNPDKTTNVLFPVFMKEVKAITERIHQAQSNGIVNANSLPSWFIEEYPEPTNENVQQLMNNLGIVIERGTNVTLPNHANTPSSQTVPYHQIQEAAKVVKPLPQLETPSLPTLETPETTETADDLQKTLQRKQVAWKSAPIMRGAIKEWAEKTPGVVLSVDGPILESDDVVTDQKPVETVNRDTFTTKVEAPSAVTDNAISDPWEEEPELPEIPEASDFQLTETSQPSQGTEPVRVVTKGFTTSTPPKAPKAEQLEAKVNNPKITCSEEVNKSDASATQEVSNSNNSNSSQNGSKPSLVKLMLAMWGNIYELGQLVLYVAEAELKAAAATFTPEQVKHIKQAATRAWYPGLNRDADYNGERVEIWEVGQSPTVKVRTKQGSVIKVRRNNLQPWLGI